jgi:hypothetical protein
MELPEKAETNWDVFISEGSRPGLVVVVVVVEGTQKTTQKAKQKATQQAVQ